MKQWLKVRQLLQYNNLEIREDDNCNTQILVIDKIDGSIGVFESKGFGATISKAHTHMKKYKRKLNPLT